MDKMEFERRLKVGEDIFATTPEQGDPEGIFNAQLQSCTWGYSKSTGDPMITREWFILDGENEQEVVTDRLILKPTGEKRGRPDSVGVRIAKQFFRKCGVVVPSSKAEAEDATNQVNEMSPCFKVQVKVTKGFTNVYVNERIEGYEGSAQAPEAAPAPAPTPTPAAAAAPALAAEPAETTATYAVDDMVEFTLADTGEIIAGKVTAVGVETVDVETADPKDPVYEVLFKDLRRVTAEVPGDVEAVGDEDDLDDFAQSHGLEIYEGETRDQVIAKIKSKSYMKNTLTPAEVAILEGIGARVLEEEKPKVSASAAKPKAKKKKKKKKRKAGR